jgi:hypothetical protein
VGDTPLPRIERELLDLAAADPFPAVSAMGEGAGGLRHWSALYCAALDYRRAKHGESRGLLAPR